MAGLSGNPDRAGHSARRAAHQQVDRIGLRCRGRGQAAIGPQHVQLHAAHGFVELLLQVAHVGGYLGPHVGIGDGGDGALVFLHFGDYFRRQGHRHAGKHALGDFAHLLLMSGIGKRVDQRHSQRFDASAGQLLQFPLQGFDVELTHHRAVGAHALVRFDGQRQRRNRQALVVDHPSAQATRNEGTGDLQYLPVTLGGHQSNSRTGAGQYGVGRHCRSVHYVGNFARIDPCVAANAADAVGHADRRILRRAGHFRGVGLPGLLVDQEQVGKRTAHIHA